MGLLRTILLPLIFIGLSASAQIVPVDTSARTWKERPRIILKTAPLSLLFSQIPLTAEARIAAEFVHSTAYSTYAGISYVFVSPVIRDSLAEFISQQGFDVKLHGFRIQGGLRYYLLYPAPHGVWIGPHGSFNRIFINFPDFPGYRAEVTFANVSLLAGVQFIYNIKFAFEGYVGLGYRYNFETYYEPGSVTTQRIDMSELLEFMPPDLKITLGIQVGYTF